MKRSGAKAEHHGPVRRRALQVLGRAEPEARPPCSRDGHELIPARSLDQDRRKIQIGPRGEPQSPPLAAQPIEHGRELLGASDHVFILECRAPFAIRSCRIAGLSRSRREIGRRRLVGRRRGTGAVPVDDCTGARLLGVRGGRHGRHRESGCRVRRVSRGRPPAPD